MIVHFKAPLGAACGKASEALISSTAEVTCKQCQRSPFYIAARPKTLQTLAWSPTNPGPQSAGAGHRKVFFDD